MIAVGLMHIYNKKVIGILWGIYMKKISKTNAMRILEQDKINYEASEYEHGPEAVDGKTAAGKIGVCEDVVYKTLVTRGAKGLSFVFIIPVSCELDLKKAAKATGEKSLNMLPSKELLPLTGYVRGGCSPVGMKKLFPTFLDDSALMHDYIFVSGGRIGCHIRLTPGDLLKATNGHAAKIVV